MRVVFADACYWIALLNPRDQLHQVALETSKDLGQCRIITTEMVLAEFLNGLSDKGPSIRERAVKTFRAIVDNPNVEVVPQTSLQFRSAVELYAVRQDKEWGLTDCASIGVMKGKSISEALTNDHHFEQAGFQILMP